MKHKTRKLVFALLIAVVSVGFFSCEKEEDQIPKVSFKESVLSVSETSTSALEIPIVTDMISGEDLTIDFEVAGTGVSGVNYEAFESQSVIIKAQNDSAILFLNPINEPAIEGDKTVEITLLPGEKYELADEKVTLTVTIKDNSTASGDAPVVMFTSENVVTNAYLQDTIEFAVGLSEALESDVNIPVVFDGSTAAEGTNYQILGLTDNNEVAVQAGEVSADFKVVVINTDELDIDKIVKASFGEPTVTTYQVDEANASREINIIDPTVTNVWFLDGVNVDGGNQKIVPQVTADGEMAYGSDCRPLDWIPVDGVYEVYQQSINDDGTYSTAAPYPIVNRSETNQNVWAANFEFIYKQVDDPCDTTPYYGYYRTMNCNPYDITDRDFFDSGYLVGYSRPGAKLDEYLRFAATKKDGSEGKVIVPEQTITFYRAADGYDWKGKSDAGNGWGEQYNYKIDANATQGIVENSSNVTPVYVTVKGEGTFNVANKEIIFTVYFSSEDQNLLQTEETYRIYPTRDDAPAK